MPNNVSVLFVHGVNSSGEYWTPFIKHLVRRLPSRHRKYLSYSIVDWKGQSSVKRIDSLDEYKGLRRTLNGAMLDVTFYLYPDGKKFIQDRIARGLLSLPEDGPIIFIGHSLGCLISAYLISDLNILNQPTENSESFFNSDQQTILKRLEGLAGFVTLGNNMALFTQVRHIKTAPLILTALDQNHKVALPGRALDAATAQQARWLNFYSSNDYLGLPMKHLHYVAPERIVDTAVKSEGWLRALILPSLLNFKAAHLGYNQNRRVVSDTIRFLQRLIDAPSTA